MCPNVVYFMIPTLPSNVSDKDNLEFLSTIAGNLSDQSSVHVNWHTHRQNPSVCWICDLNILVSKILYYTKSSLDMETELSSEDDSDSEIESESFNKDEEGTPEYETLEESDQMGDIS